MAQELGLHPHENSFALELELRLSRGIPGVRR